MAKCPLCKTKRMFLKRTEYGLCHPCTIKFLNAIQQQTRIIEDSVKIINNSKKIDTVLSRMGVAENSMGVLLQYEQIGLDCLISPSVAQGLEEIAAERPRAIKNYFEDQLVKARTKSQAAKSGKAKISPYQKILEQIGALYTEIEDVTPLEEMEILVRKEMDQVELEAQLLIAEQAEFKGQKAKAIDAYMDALFIIKKDSIKDKNQSKVIRDIRKKITDLGGSPPALK